MLYLLTDTSLWAPMALILGVTERNLLSGCVGWRPLCQGCVVGNTVEAATALQAADTNAGCPSVTSAE